MTDKPKGSKASSGVLIDTARHVDEDAKPA